ncbi:MAG TPA: PSD1 and planctomycete cytochrome C domain-containing protein [Lacipirellulaceae bacterium]
MAVSAACGAPPQFNHDIRPILADRCFACHGPDSGTRKAELRLDTFEGATDWAIVPGDAESSEVSARVASDDPEYRMPPAESKKPPLTPQEVALLREWIDAGAEYEQHWSYIPPKRPTVPEVHVAAPVRDVDASDRPGESSIGGTRLRDWPRNPIDQFLLAKMQVLGVEPSPEANRATLVRRLYFDLTGMPPTTEEIDEFLKDDGTDAYERLVDKLLASPAFGERMATWWFDLVRFANTVGYHGDQEHRITPYRDYVIKSFNDNLPFDQFTIEQLAGDLLPNPTMWQRVATGYNRILQTTHEGGAQDGEYRAKYLADRVRNFSEAWLAASMGCAECHDHKFDPYTQEDFYSLAAFFADVDWSGHYKGLAVDVTPTQRPPEMLAWTLPVYERIEKLDARIAKLDKSLAGPLKKGWEQRRDKLIELKRRRLELEAQFVPTMITKAVEPREIRVLPRGNWMDKSGKVVQPRVPQFMQQMEANGRRATRLELARWLVARENPLTARVVVNRLWKLYFGVGLSKELIDLGTRGEVPPNQELLDWLAVEFIAPASDSPGWDMKHMIRLMVTTSAYRQSSLPRAELDALDAENRLVARQSRFRLEAEQIRDSALAVSGLLVRRVGGEVVRPYQPAKYYSSLNFPERDYTPSSGDDQFRRAVYVHWQRQFLHPWLLAFDAPTREECTASRPVSSTPAAALVLLNDPSFVEAARGLASRILGCELKDDEQRIRWAWRQVLGRDVKSQEVSLLVRLLQNHRDQFRADPQAAEALISIGISPRADEIDAVELAAWTSVSRVLLNLNETITRN